MKELSIKVKKKGVKGPGCFEYKNRVNLEDFKQLAIVFSDLEIHGANIEKAFIEFKKDKPWPF